MNTEVKTQSFYLHVPQIYPVMERSSQRTRLALIICNIEFENLSKRTGAEIDTKDMTTLLEDLGYSVEVRGDLTASVNQCRNLFTCFMFLTHARKI